MTFHLIQTGAVDSTNSEALRRLEAGQALPLFVVADEQTRGRGRGGKAWTSPKGNFYGTFALTADQDDGVVAQVSFVAAVALAKVMTDLGLAPQLKWPNDILIKGAKISGILLEKHGPALLVGMGVNVSHHPGLVSYPSTSLNDCGIEISLDQLSAQLAHDFQTQYAIWQTQGFGPIRAAWLQRAYGLNQTIAVRLPGQEARGGIFEGLGADGALQLRTPGGLDSIHAGEVYFDAVGH